jgi:xanthine dehydrogenase molybdenum-binding subunit
MARTKYVGSNYIPPDLHAKITGRAKYSEDFRAEGMLFAKLLLSPMPHCRVRSVDYSAALAMEGVVAVLTADELPEAPELSERALTNHPVYEGEPILAVAAITEELAADAIEKIRIDLEPLPFALEPLDSLRPGSPNARPEGNSIVRKRTETGMETVVEEVKWPAEIWDAARPDELPIGPAQDEWVIGDVETALAAADLVLERSFYNHSLTHHPLEPRSCMAYWQDGKCYVHASTQSAARTQGLVARAIGADPKDVVFISEFCGGGFGSKIVGSINMAIAPLLAKKTGRPVMHRVTRYEENYFGRARPGLHVRAKMGFRRDGRIVGMDLFMVQDSGPYGREPDMGTAGQVASLAYQPEHMRYRGLSVLTNTPPRSPQRGPGGAPITAMLEPLMDQAAKELGIDRLAIRRLNAPTNDAKFEAERGNKVTTAYVNEAFDKLDALVDWQAANRRSGQRNGSKVTGVGIVLSTFTAGASGFDGLMVIRPDGRLQIHSGIGNLGTHSVFDTSRVAADVLGLPWEECDVLWGSSAKNPPWTTVQAGSMTTHCESRAVHAGAMDAQRKLQEIAARDLGGSPGSYDVGDGRVVSRATGRSMTFARAAQRAIELGGKYDGHELPEDINAMTKASATAVAGTGLMGVAKDTYPRDGGVFSFVVSFAEVEVDTETGSAELKSYVTVTDCGTVMNPRSLGAQLFGGGIQGIGLARSQKWVFDPKWGIPFAHRFYTARPPGILDVPLDLRFDAVDLPDPNNPVGSKGIGEPPVGAGAAAFLCALQDAVGPEIFQRTPMMTDGVLGVLEGLPTIGYAARNSHT